MLRAVVVGNVWATKKLEELPNGAFLEVEVEGSGSRVIAFDVLGSCVGEQVLVVQGSVASAWFTGAHPPVDALIIGSIDEPTAKPAGRAAATPAVKTTTRTAPAVARKANRTS